MKDLDKKWYPTSIIGCKFTFGYRRFCTVDHFITLYFNGNFVGSTGLKIHMRICFHKYSVSTGIVKSTFSLIGSKSCPL